MRITVFSLCVVALLAGCGIKPSRVDAPPGTVKDSFPRVYPDPKTDPAPEAK